jgi:probable O-glycosylation ligase (exosortase A-associated)
MRDLVIAILVIGALPWVLMRPYIGALMYAWLGLMNPHRLTFGFAYSFPFGMIVALVTIVAMLFSSEKKHIPWSPTLVVWLLVVFWFCVTTIFALNPEDAILEWDRAIKIQLMILVTVLLIHGQFRINAFVWVIVISLGFFGVKGGIFTILTGGQYVVMGPWDSFITDNNTLALALIMTLPLMRYLSTVTPSRYVRLGLVAMMGLTGMSILSSHSRGALLAGATILLFLILKSRHRLQFGIVALIAVPVMLMSMPDAWFDRMGTISDFEQDASALGRINAWWFAFNLAKDHPIVGGGFDVFTTDLFLKYAPNPTDHHDAHSIYFEILAEHGFVGLGLFLLLGVLALKSCSGIIKIVKDRDDLIWTKDLAAMLQVSLIGYATGGAFLGLAYFDLYYDLIALVIVLQYHVREQLRASAPDEDYPKQRRPQRSAPNLSGARVPRRRAASLPGNTMKKNRQTMPAANDEDQE